MHKNKYHRNGAMLFAVFVIVIGAMVSGVFNARRVVPNSEAELMKSPPLFVSDYFNLSSRLVDERRYLSTTETLVTSLPGLAAEDASRLTQHAGYLQLSGNVGAIFYWMFENPDPDTPLILWFNGGPVSFAPFYHFSIFHSDRKFSIPGLFQHGRAVSGAGPAAPGPWRGG
jgi:hypothetical protein